MNSMGWTTSELLASWGLEAEFHGDKALLRRQLVGVTIDSRQVLAGEVFVALRGERFDAHDFLDQAFARQAIFAIVDRRWWQAREEGWSGGACLVVDDTLEALQHMARAYRRRLSPTVVGITGTNGKTTTKELTANVLESRFVTHRTAGNLNNHIGVPLSLLAMRPGVEVAVVEMGMNHAGEIAALCAIAEPEVGLITNIGRGHTEFLHSIDGVRRAKQELFEALAATGVACVNGDDAQVVRAAASADVQQQITYAFTAPAMVQGEALRLDDDGHAVFRWQQTTMRVGVPGLHNAGNALGALAIAHHFGLQAAEVQAALSQPLALSGRSRRLDIGGRQLFDDTYNANPESMRAAIDMLLAAAGSHRAYAALGDMLELGEGAVAEHRALLQFAIARGVHQVFAFGPLMQQAAAMVPEHAGKVEIFADKKEMASRLWQQSRKGDAILAKGSRGMRMEEVVREFERLAAA